MILQKVYKCDVCGKYSEDGVGWFHLSHTQGRDDTVVWGDYCSVACVETGVSELMDECKSIAGEDVPSTVEKYTDEAPTDPTLTVFGAPPIFGGIPWYPKRP